MSTKLSQKFGISAEATEHFQSLSHVQMPQQIGDKVVTLNSQGFMRVELDQFSLAWIKEATKSDLPFLEIGAAYGQSSLQALNAGATVIANDISLEHLEIVRRRAIKTHRSRLFLNHSTFPEEMELPPESLGGVLFCRVGHFFSSAQIELAFKKIYSWLVPGGKIYFVATSPYHYMFKNSFLPIFEQRIKEGRSNPGYVYNLKEILPESAEHVPSFMHVFNEATITSLIANSGLLINNCKLFDYSSRNSQGKGFVGAEATKPL